MSDEQLLTVTEVARYLRVSRQSIYNWKYKGLLPFVQVGRHIRFRKEDVDSVFKSSKEGT